MKKVFLLIIAIVSVLHTSAQEVDSLPGQSVDISIDSLSYRLNKLQHDFNFMYCDYELHKVMVDLKDLSSSIDISSNRVLINYYNGRYDRALYKAYVENYDANCALFDSLKKRIEITRKAILVKIASSDFSEQELNVLSAGFGVIEQSVSTVETALNYYDVAIKAYRSKM